MGFSDSDSPLQKSIFKFLRLTGLSDQLAGLPDGATVDSFVIILVIIEI